MPPHFHRLPSNRRLITGMDRDDFSLRVESAAGRVAAENSWRSFIRTV
jgi:hypothetical protein